MIIKFSDDATTATMGQICEALEGWTIEVEYADGVTGFPQRCSVDCVTWEEVVICDVNEEGAPMPESLYHVGYDEIKTITVI